MIITTATKKIAKLSKRIRIAQGGTGASKTMSILIGLIELAQKDKTPTLTSIVSESIPHLKKGCIRDFKNILKEHDYWKEDGWAETDKIYTFETGSQIEFFGADQSEKLRGGRRNRLFINECNNVSFNAFEELEVRTKEFIYLDFNPVSDFWLFQEIVGKRNDYELIVLNYLDNEALDEETKKSIEQRKNRLGWWKVYGLGELGEIEGRIFKGWQIIDEVPFEARLERRWLDFGFTNDQTAIGSLYYYNGGYVLDEILYQTGLKNKQIADILLAQPEPQTLIVADSAEPKSIEEIHDFGLNIIGVTKTAGETKNEGFVKWSINLVQEEKISVTKRSVNIIKEYRNYFWLVDKDNRVLNVEDPKCSNHHMRGIAYAISNLTPLKRRQELRRIMGKTKWQIQNNPIMVNPV